jgi:hypothetical protein
VDAIEAIYKKSAMQDQQMALPAREIKIRQGSYAQIEAVDETMPNCSLKKVDLSSLSDFDMIHEENQILSIIEVKDFSNNQEHGKRGSMELHATDSAAATSASDVLPTVALSPVASQSQAVPVTQEKIVIISAIPLDETKAEPSKKRRRSERNVNVRSQFVTTLFCCSPSLS